MLIFSCECLKNIADAEFLPLLHAHWEEVGKPCCPGSVFRFNRAAHERLEREGLWKAFLARGEKGRILGYAAYFLSPHAFMAERVATLEVVYIEPSQRNGQNALALLRFAEASLARENVNAVHYGSPAARDCGALFRRLGCRVMETLWRKEISS